MDQPELRELRYFRAVAQELNFSRAATRLGIAQPPLSRAIRRLERRLAVQLFERSTRAVALTPAGATLLEESQHVMDAVAVAVRRTLRTAQPRDALVATAKPGIGSELLAQFAAEHSAPVEIVVSGFGEQARMVRDGRADVALLGCPGETDGLDVEPLHTEPRMAALATGHRLAGRRTLRCADLAGLPTPVWPGSSAGDRAYWAGQDVGDGEVVAGPIVTDSAQLLETVALGQAVALLPVSVTQRTVRPDITYLAVVDATSYTLALGWRAGLRDARVAAFVRTAMEHGPLHMTGLGPG